MPSQEILHLRDWQLSERHRAWGRNCPMIDLDFLAVEFDTLIPRGICEYKHCNTRFTDDELCQRAGIRVVRTLANLAGLAAWVAVYNPNNWSFRVVALNEIARTLFGGKKIFTERDYVERIYHLRGSKLPADIEVQLNATFHGIEELDDSGFPIAA